MTNDDILARATYIADLLLDVQSDIKRQIEATMNGLLAAVQRRLDVLPEVTEGSFDLVNTRIAGSAVVVTPASVAAALPLSAKSAATTATGRTSISRILAGDDQRLVVVAGPCSIHDPTAALEYASFIASMRRHHSEDLEIIMRTYTEKPRTEVDWKGFAYDPFLDASNRISIGLIATRMLMGQITALGVPVAAEPLNALTPQYVDGLVTYNGVGARNVTDQTARERVSGFSSVIGFKNAPDGTVGSAIQAVVAARARHEFLGVDRHGLTAQLATTGNSTGHVILRGGISGPNYSADHIAEVKRDLDARNLPRAVVVDASHGNSGKNHLRQFDVIDDLAGQVAGGELAIRGVMIESNLVAGRQTLSPHSLKTLTYGQSVTDSCVDLAMTEELLDTLARASRRRRQAEMSALVDVER